MKVNKVLQATSDVHNRVAILISEETCIVRSGTGLGFITKGGLGVFSMYYSQEKTRTPRPDILSFSVVVKTWIIQWSDMSVV